MRRQQHKQAFCPATTPLAIGRPCQTVFKIGRKLDRSRCHAGRLNSDGMVGVGVLALLHLAAPQPADAGLLAPEPFQ